MYKLLMEMIATDILPFSVVEGAAFKRVMAQAEPRYPLKTETFFRAKKMDEMYTGVVNKIQKLLSVENAGKNISFTTDCWSGSNKALMSLTAHFIDKNWKKVQLVLNFKSLTQSHTGQYIGETYLSMLQEWEIDVERVMLVLRDSGANMVKGMRLVEMPDLSCSAHIRQLVINDGLESGGGHSGKAQENCYTFPPLCYGSTTPEGPSDNVRGTNHQWYSNHEKNHAE